eukprot:scaffold14084_cov140-Isochrysis_galbana.AAC.1
MSSTGSPPHERSAIPNMVGLQLPSRCTPPSAATASVWKWPADTRTTIVPSRRVTRFGSDRAETSPWPSLPNRPLPHVNSWPASVMAQLWSLPAATSQMHTPRSASISFGLQHHRTDWPWPRLPSLSKPHEKTAWL